jgi:hypothetical protein
MATDRLRRTGHADASLVLHVERRANDYGRHLQIRISNMPLNHGATPVWEMDGAATLNATFAATTGQYLLVSQSGTLTMGTSWWSLHTLDVVCQ